MMINSSKYEYIPQIVSICGDSNEDGKINIADALETQKVLAEFNTMPKLISEYDEKISFYSYDYNLDDNITVEDVLGVQKEIANIYAG